MPIQSRLIENLHFINNNFKIVLDNSKKDKKLVLTICAQIKKLLTKLYKVYEIEHISKN